MSKLKKLKYQIILQLGKWLNLPIVEDVENLDIIVCTLKYGGIKFTYKVADHAINYQKLLKNHVFDLILLNYYLVDFDVWEILRLLQESGQEIPVTVIREKLKEARTLAIFKAAVNHYKSRDRLFTLPIILKQAIAESRCNKPIRDTKAGLTQENPPNPVSRRCLLLNDLSYKPGFFA